METVRVVLAIALAIGVIILTNVLFPPAQPPTEPAADTVVVSRDTAAGDAATADTARLDTTGDARAARPGPSGTPADTIADADPDGTDTAGATPGAEEAAPAAADGGLLRSADGTERPAYPAGDTIWIESPLYRYGISTAGGGIVAARLLEFQSFTREGAVELVPDAPGGLLGYALELEDGRTLDLRGLNFRAEPAGGITFDSAGGADRTLRLIGRDPASDLAVALEYTFKADGYAVGVRGRVAGVDDATLLLEMGPRLAENEVDPEEDRRFLAYVVNNRTEGITSVNLNDVEGERVQEGPLIWAGMKNKYFLAVAIVGPDIAGTYFGGLIANEASSDTLPGANLAATLGLRDAGFRYQLYMGPQEPDRLTAMGYDLEDANPYGWRIFRPIIQPLAHLVTSALTGMHNVLGFGYGWVLILFGVGIRLALWPLNAKAMRSQLKTMELQPVIKEIQSKYKEQPEKLKEEMFRLYKEEGFNPLGGCLPMLIPWPILITLFFVFQNTIVFRGVSFLWLPDLSLPDPLYILPVVMGGSIFLLQWMSSRSMARSNPQQKLIMWVMPGVMIVIFFRLASGLNLYYAASNLASLPQQIQIMQERKRVRSKMKGSEKSEESGSEESGSEAAAAS